MATKLTAAAIENLKPTATRREIPDGHMHGLFFVLQPSGKASWAVRYRLRNSRTTRKLTLGPYPALGLKDARIRAAKALTAVADGGDPAADKQASRREATIATETVKAVVDKYIERQLKKSGRRSWPETKRILEKEIVGLWGARSIASLSRKDVLALLDAVVDRGSPVMANRVLAALRPMCSWAVKREIMKASPCEGVEAPTTERSRDRVLSDQELAAAWKGCDTIGWPFAPLFRLLILTGQRLREVAGMRWSEVDLDRRVWTLPRDRAKNDIEHVVPLSPPAIAIIEALPRIEGQAGFVFTTSGETAVTGFSRAKSRLDGAIGEGMPKWVLHDLRRSFASGCAGQGISLPVIEKLLNHVSGSFAGIVGVYQRHSFADEKRAAMDAWGRHVEALIGAGAGGKVIELKAVRA